MPLHGLGKAANHLTAEVPALESVRLGAATARTLTNSHPCSVARRATVLAARAAASAPSATVSNNLHNGARQFAALHFRLGLLRRGDVPRLFLLCRYIRRGRKVFAALRRALDTVDAETPVTASYVRQVSVLRSIFTTMTKT